MMFAILLLIGLLVAGRQSQELDGRHMRVALLGLVSGGILIGVLGAPLVVFTGLVVVVDMVLLLKVFKGDLLIR